MRKDLNASVYLFGGSTGREQESETGREGKQYRGISEPFTTVAIRLNPMRPLEDCTQHTSESYHLRARRVGIFIHQFLSITG